MIIEYHDTFSMAAPLTEYTKQGQRSVERSVRADGEETCDIYERMITQYDGNSISHNKFTNKECLSLK
jgi:hypothetical protein